MKYIVRYFVKLSIVVGYIIYVITYTIWHLTPSGVKSRNEYDKVEKDSGYFISAMTGLLLLLILSFSIVSIVLFV